MAVIYAPEALTSQGYAPPAVAQAFNIPDDATRVWHFDATVTGNVSVSITATSGAGLSLSYRVKDSSGTIIGSSGTGGGPFTTTLTPIPVVAGRRYWVHLQQSTGTGPVTGTFTPSNGTGTISSSQAFPDNMTAIDETMPQYYLLGNYGKLTGADPSRPAHGQLWPRANTQQGR